MHELLDRLEETKSRRPIMYLGTVSISLLLIGFFTSDILRSVDRILHHDHLAIYLLFGLCLAAFGLLFLTIDRMRAIERQRSAEALVEAERARLEEAVESLGEGFALFDADDSLILCNSRYRALYPLSAPLMQPGISFEDLIRHGIERGEYLAAVGRSEEFLAERLHAHRTADGQPLEQVLNDGRVLRISERRTRDGGTVGIRSDITELKERERELEASERRYRFLAFHDSLTGLGNRAFFNDTLDCLLETALPDEAQTAMLLLDIDGFKEVNDLYGNEIGDEVLKVVARRILSILPDGSIAARVAPDQFALAASFHNGADVAKRLAETAMSVFDEEFAIDVHRLRIKATAGIAVFPEHADSAEKLFARSDLALHRAKQTRRGSWLKYDPEIAAHQGKQRRLEVAIERALREGELDLALQPKLSLRRGSISGLEALLRWYDPVRGANVPPGDFIPVAERSSLILDIDRHVLRNGCRRAVALRERHGMDISIAINLSGAHFRHSQLVDLVDSVLDSSGLPPRLLEIELTEGVLVQDRNLSEAIVSKLHEIGVTISLDDFGTGYSSLAYLRDLPLDRLKIDRSFVTGLEQNARDRSIVKTFVALGQELGMTVVAEGVETIGQLRFLERIGCDDVQGYLIAKPLMGEDLDDWLEKRQWQSTLDQLSERHSAE